MLLTQTSPTAPRSPLPKGEGQGRGRLTDKPNFEFFFLIFQTFPPKKSVLPYESTPITPERRPNMPEKLPDERIIALYNARDEKAIQATADKYGNFCMSLSYDILKSRPDAEECVNDTYLRAWNSIPPAKPKKLQAFLAAITRRLSLDRYREQRAAKRNRDLEISFEELSDMIEAPDDRADELPELFNDFLRTLDRPERRLFLRRYWFSVTVEALAKEEGTTKNAITVRLYKTRNKLKSYLQERGYTV